MLASKNFHLMDQAKEITLSSTPHHEPPHKIMLLMWQTPNQLPTNIPITEPTLMASATAAITRANVLPLPTTARRNPHPSAALPPGLPTTTTMARAPARLVVKSSVSTTTMTTMAKEKVVAGLTTTALAMAMLIPDIAEAAQPGFSPSLKNFLLSIVSGGVVLGILLGAIIGVANFDPVKRT